MIVSGGENIYPAEIESVLFGSSGYRRYRGHRGAGRTVGSKPSRRLWCQCSMLSRTADGILRYARERLAGYKIPEVD